MNDVPRVPPEWSQPLQVEEKGASVLVPQEITKVCCDSASRRWDVGGLFLLHWFKHLLTKKDYEMTGPWRAC